MQPLPCISSSHVVARRCSTPAGDTRQCPRTKSAASVLSRTENLSDCRGERVLDPNIVAYASTTAADGTEEHGTADVVKIPPRNMQPHLFYGAAGA